MRKIYLPTCAALLLHSAIGAAADRVNMPGEPVPRVFEVGTRAGDPLDHLPPNVRLISSFGERGVFSPDSGKIAFIGESFGDAFEYDIATGTVRNLTVNVPHRGFLRIHYLRDGSLILTGPHRPAETSSETRFKRSEIWWMDAEGSRPPSRLGPMLFEGVAVSPASNRIAWVESDPSGMPQRDQSGTSTLKVGTVVVADGTAHLENVRELIRMPHSECILEAQDFFPDDSAVLTVCYSREHKGLAVPLDKGAITVYPLPAGLYGEIEGIFPDGRRTLVECGNDHGAGLDLCILELQPDQPRYTRLTHVMDYGSYRFSNPQVSRDGRRIVFQWALAGDEAGTGSGLLLMTLPEGF